MVSCAPERFVISDRDIVEDPPVLGIELPLPRFRLLQLHSPRDPELVGGDDVLAKEDALRSALTGLVGIRAEIPRRGIGQKRDLTVQTQLLADQRLGGGDGRVIGDGNPLHIRQSDRLSRTREHDRRRRFLLPGFPGLGNLTTRLEDLR